MHQPSQSELTTQSFIEATSLCHQICLHTAMNHCIETGGKHIKAKHLRLMLNCAEICEACAAECDEIGHMEDCVEACQTCADSCRQMLSTQH